MAPGVRTRQPEAITAHPANSRKVPQRQPEAITAVPTTQMLSRVGLKKDRLGPMTWPRGERPVWLGLIRVGGYRAWSRGVAPRSLRQWRSHKML